MNSIPPPSANAPKPDDLGWDLAMLRELAETGLKLAKTFAQCTQDAAEERGIDPESSADPGRPFAQMARCVRQTLALRARFIKDQRNANKPETPERESRAARDHHRKRKALVRGAIEEFIETTSDRGDREHLLADLDEYLDDEEATDDFDTRPIGRIVVALCDVMGVAVDETLFSDEELGILAFDPKLPRSRDPNPLGRQAKDSRFRERKFPEPHPVAGRRSRGAVRPGKPDPLGDDSKPPHKIDPLPD